MRGTRVAVVHSSYQGRSSGENTSVQAQLEARINAGAVVDWINVSTDDLQDQLGPLRYRWRAVENLLHLRANRDFQRVSNSRPELVHIHNAVPNLDASFVKKLDVPLVVSYHNFRYSCMNGLFYRDGAMCFDCSARGSTAGIRHGCYQGNRAASLLLHYSGVADPSRSHLVTCADAIVVHSQREKRLAIQAGISGSKLRVIENFVSAKPNLGVREGNGRFLIAGRNSAEKGFDLLTRHWPDEVPLDYAGDRPLESGSSYLGLLSHEEFQERISHYSGLVIPSLWLENGYPRVALEAMARGVPVIAYNSNAAADLVQISGGGRVFGTFSENSLRRATSEVLIDVSRVGVAKFAAERFSEERWVREMSDLYGELIGKAQAP